MSLSTAFEHPTPNIHGLIVAAGKGQRFGRHIAKQYTQVAGQTVLEHSVSRLAASQYLSQMTIVVAADDKLIHTLQFPLAVRLTEGGAERWHSVRAGVMDIIDSGADANDLVVIHDAARPCIDSKYVDAVIKTAMYEPFGAILGSPVTDTLKRVSKKRVSKNKKAPTVLFSDHKNSPEQKHERNHQHITNNSKPETSTLIIETVDRQDLWQAQTPQVFRLGKLVQVLDHIETQGLSITDEASAFEVLNYPIRIVEGDRLNIKLTYPSDLALLEAILTIKL